MLYSSGRGIGQDWIKAHLWLNIAASGGYVGATQQLDYISSRMNESELAQARQLAREWRTANVRDAKNN